MTPVRLPGSLPLVLTICRLRIGLVVGSRLVRVVDRITARKSSGHRRFQTANPVGENEFDIAKIKGRPRALCFVCLIPSCGRPRP